MNFQKLNNHIIPMSQFALKWRFTEEKYNILPKQDLNQLKPLDEIGARFLGDFIDKSQLHSQVPFKKDFFRNIEYIQIIDGNQNKVTNWLDNLEQPGDKEIYLSWDNSTAIITTYEYVVKYWDSLYYEASDDLTVFDQNLEWCLLFFHEDIIYFGTNRQSKQIIESKEQLL